MRTSISNVSLSGSRYLPSTNTRLVCVPATPLDMCMFVLVDATFCSCVAGCHGDVSHCSFVNSALKTNLRYISWWNNPELRHILKTCYLKQVKRRYLYSHTVVHRGPLWKPALVSFIHQNCCEDTGDNPSGSQVGDRQTARPFTHSHWGEIWHLQLT